MLDKYPAGMRGMPGSVLVTVNWSMPALSWVIIWNRFPLASKYVSPHC